MSLRWSVILILGGLTAATPAAAANMFGVPGPGGTTLDVPVKTFVQMRFRDMVRQAYDVSCGAAALATVLKYFYGEKTTERKVIDQIMETASKETKEKISRDGFSMLELKKEGERFGLVSGGFRIPKAESLENLKIPAITLINVRGYDHFVVIRSVQDGKVYIADPAFGNRSETLSSFADGWRHVILVFLSKNKVGKGAFRTTTQVRGREDEVFDLIDRGIPTIPHTSGEF